MYKLIVADSSPSVQKAVQLAFAELNFEISPFEDGREALKSLSQISPDAVLLSLSLPGKDGYEVGHYLRSLEEFRDISLIFLRGAFEPFDKERVANLDYDAIVQKPFDSGKLARLVKDLIDRKKDPKTLPEEPLLDEMPFLSQKPQHQGDKQDSMIQIEDIARRIVKEEMLEVERELEKRIRVKIFHDLKTWIEEQFKAKDEK